MLQIKKKNIYSNRPDNVSVCLLYNCQNVLVYSLNFLFRHSLSEGIFPIVWKIYSINPISKSRNLSDVFNYKPTSILLIWPNFLNPLITTLALKEVLTK